MRLSTIHGLVAALTAIAAVPAAAEVRLEGYFIARDECAATQSIRTGANPGTVVTEIGRAYDMLAGNKEPPSHFLIRVPGATPDRRWVSTGCGVHATDAGGSPAPVTPPAGGGGEGGGQAATRVDHVLAASWQPGFCETRPAKTECETQTPDRFDASHFALHGLWPQPRSNVYCQVAPDMAAADKAGRWEDLPDVALPQDVRAELDKVMPGAASFLDRHEWIKHGTCYGDTMEEYYSDSLAVMADLNASAVRDLFAANIGATLTAGQIRDAFDAAFGPGAGSRVRVACVTDPSNGRRLIGELTIGLSGEIDGETTLSDLIFAAAPTADAGCPQGIVDAAGLQ
ncbi:ribonuclease [Aquibium sp. ELW1220]|uniref:ribonuclease T2 family protein n=1 Tax=Aquibium sp. ELW1220 TaxID=2976766 RepID=UPI0025B056AC|nr:ribonuclease [Aquibium sp. ELW1220]MDN2583720.1 ribonuclease [Aquibium sp. ELW1220]